METFYFSSHVTCSFKKNSQLSSKIALLVIFYPSMKPLGLIHSLHHWSHPRGVGGEAGPDRPSGA